MVVLVTAACAVQGPTPPTANQSVPPSGSVPPPASTASTVASSTPTAGASDFTVTTFVVPPGSHPHDVAPAVDGGVWYTAQAASKLGWLDPANGHVKEIGLGNGSAPHGVIVGPDGAPWVTDPGLHAIVRVDGGTHAVRTFPAASDLADPSPHTAVFDPKGILWFTGQNGYSGRLDPATGEVRVSLTPGGPGPYGITATPSGEVYFAQLARSYLGLIDRASGNVTVFDPPTPNAGVRRCWSDSRGRIWVSEWNVGQVGVFDPADHSWREWKLPGAQPMAYAVFVDDHDIVWLSDFGANAIVRFDPATETFVSIGLGAEVAEVRQLNGRPGEVWGAESALDRLVVIHTAPGA